MTENPPSQQSTRWAEPADEVLEPVVAGSTTGLETFRKPLDTGAYPHDGAAMNGERRRNGRPGDSPMDILTRLPAVVALERIAVPTLAVARDDSIVFANTAFAEMVGYQQDELAGLAFSQIFRTVPAEVCMLDALANLIVELRHCEGWTVRARMSKSALTRRDDPIVLVTFENLTERLWTDELPRGW